jgi:hypothetical protein
LPDRDIVDLIEALELPNWSSAQGAPGAGRMTAAGSDYLDRLITRSRAGDRAAEAAFRLARDMADDGCEPAGGAGHDQLDTLADSYAAARSIFDLGDLASAVTVLCRLLARSDAICELPLALAICAARLRKFEAARDLAVASLECNPRYPRTLCVLGICDLLRGSKAEAQGRLALAARLARGHPEYREDMRTAQKLLLIRHLS